MAQASIDLDQEVLREIEQAWLVATHAVSLPRLQERISRQAGIALDRATFRLLVWLNDNGETRLSELAHRQGTDVSTVSRQIQQCEREGLVQRGSDPTDQRAIRLRLTDEGRDAVIKVRAARRAAFATVLEGWSPEEMETFATLLERFTESFRSFMGDPQ
jgi:DNA-binding MarR family transcriptional regulator